MAKTKDTSAPDPAPLPRMSVLERRLQNPFGEPSQRIRFKRENIEARWFNDDARHGQIHRAKELGWEPVTLDMIADADSLGHHTLSAAQQITRGPRGQEVLMWMPATDYRQVQWAKTRKNLDDMHDMDRSKHDMLNAAAAQFGGNAAEYLNQHVGPTGRVTDNYERIERVPEPE